MTKLNTFGLSRALTTLRLQGEDSEEISNDADTDDILRSLAATEMVAPRFRWRRSRWGRLCPVELYNGSIVNGSPQYAVRYGNAEVNHFPLSGRSSVGQNKLLQLILGYIYVLKHLQSNFIGKILFFGNS